MNAKLKTRLYFMKPIRQLRFFRSKGLMLIKHEPTKYLEKIT
jgi:hypothetical protein